MNTIALCIPAYNAEIYLPQLLESAHRQSLPFDEILVYDDCSTDDTGHIAAKFGVTLIRGDYNRGCSFAKNALAQMAKSDWLHFHDADDDLLPNFTEVAHKWINLQHTPDIILLNFEYRLFSNFELLGKPNYNRSSLKEDHVKFVISNKIMNFAICNKSKFLEIGGFDTHPAVLYNEDRAFYSRAIANQLTFDYEEIVTCINFRYENSMSVSNVEKCAKAHYEVSLFLIEHFGKSYPIEIAECLWENATISASLQNWELTNRQINSAKSLGSKFPKGQSILFNALCLLNSKFAFFIREKLIRILKPQLR